MIFFVPIFSSLSFECQILLIFLEFSPLLETLQENLVSMLVILCDLHILFDLYLFSVCRSSTASFLILIYSIFSYKIQFLIPYSLNSFLSFYFLRRFLCIIILNHIQLLLFILIKI